LFALARGTIAERLQLRAAKKDRVLQEREALADEVRRTQDTDLPLHIRDTREKGRGVFASTAICNGTFVIEYTGELLSGAEAHKREQMYSQEHSLGSYMYYFKWRDQTHCVDATVDNGRLGRLVNHSKLKANLQTRIFEHQGVPHIMFFAARDIDTGEELLYDYGERRQEAVKDFPWLAL